MHSWEVVCVEIADDSEFNDCRAIDEIGYLAPTLRRKPASVIGAQIKQGHKNLHITVDGREVQLQPAKDDDVHFYVRTLDEDSSDDPLLDQQSCDKYELEDRVNF
jgi:hypothetical protein